MVKMRVNTDTQSVCQECGTKYNNTLEMYDLMVAGIKFTICKDCSYAIFQKTLKASCMYNEKLKTKDDLKRMGTYMAIKEGKKK